MGTWNVALGIQTWHPVTGNWAPSTGDHTLGMWHLAPEHVETGMGHPALGTGQWE